MCKRCANRICSSRPASAGSLDWAAALTELDVVALDPATVSDTLGVLLKYQDDIARIEGTKAKELLDAVHAEDAGSGSEKDDVIQEAEPEAHLRASATRYGEAVRER